MNTLMAVAIAAAFVLVAPIEAEAAPFGLPGPPTITTVAAGDAQVTFSWAPPIDTGGQPIVRYHLSIFIGPSAELLRTITSNGFSGPPTVLGGFENGETYRLAIAGETSAGVGPASPMTDPFVPLIIAPYADSDALVRAQFDDFLGRSPTPTEGSHWRALANAGDLDPSEVIAGIANLPESAGPSARMSRLYEAYYRRLPDIGGYRFWTGRLRRGTSLLQVSNTFAASSEFQRTYGQLDDGAFVDLVYLNVLGRTADPSGRAYWVRRLAAGLSRGKVMATFSESSEFIRKTGSKSTSVLFRTAMLRRQPTAADLSGDVAELDGPGDSIDLAFALLASAEHHARFGATLPGPDAYVWLRGPALGSVVGDATGRFAYVTDPGRDEVAVIDVPRRLVVDRIRVGRDPAGLDLSPDGSRLYVANRGDRTVSEIALADRAERRAIAMPTVDGDLIRPGDVAVASTGAVVVTATVDGLYRRPVLRIDPATVAIKTLASTANAPFASACPGRSVIAVGNLYTYRASTDALSSPNIALPGTSDVACSRDGESFLVAGAILADADRRQVADFGPFPLYRNVLGVVTADGAMGLQVDAAGDPAHVAALDLRDGHTGQRLPLPEPVADRTTGSLALVDDDKTLLVVTTRGLAVVAAPDSVTPAVGPEPATPGSSLVPTAGRITDVEIGPDGSTAWATNLDRNTVEVFDLATRARLTVIPVGSKPMSIAFAPDGTTAYVGVHGSAYLSVLDVASRSEVRRVLPQAAGYEHEYPEQIAVAADGAMFLSSFNRLNSGSSVWRLDPGTERAVLNSRLSAQSGQSAVTATGDHRKILLTTDAYNGAVRWYDASTRKVGPALTGARHRTMALDDDGDVGFTGFEATGPNLQPTCLVAEPQGVGGRGAVRADGRVGYRLGGTSVEVIDLGTCAVTSQIPTDDVPATNVQWSREVPGSIAVTPDGSIVAVATPNGLAIVRVGVESDRFRSLGTDPMLGPT